MRNEFKVWREDGETEDDARKVTAYDAKEAAEALVMMKFSNWDYPTDIDMVVKDDGGVITKWNVTVISIPEFTATKISK